MIRLCKVCKKEFITYPSRIKIGSGKYCSRKCSDKITLIKKGKRIGKNTEFKKGQFENERHRNWKGNKASYSALHYWVKRKLGKPKKCILCNSIKRVQWANKSHKYKRDLDDWLELCQKCHIKYDKNSWGSIKLKYTKNGTKLL